jgi:hypothetical protein
MKPSKMTLATTLVTVAAFGVFAGACSSSSKTSTSTTSPVTSAGSEATTTSAAPASTSLTITAEDYKYIGVPATIPAGIVNVTFVNKGTIDHEMAFLKVTNNADTQTAFTALAGVFQGKPFPASFLALNGVHDTDPGKTTVTQFNLTPGQYIALCGDSGVVGSNTQNGPPHFTRGMYERVTVTGTGGNTAPTAPSTLTAHDYGFDTSGLKAGPQTVLFKNLGPVQWHFADIMEFPKGTTMPQALAAVPKLLASNGPPPAGVPAPQDLGGSQAASPGNGNTFTTTLEKGRIYVVLCFLTDKAGSAPHAISHKMYKVFTVS